MIFTGRSRELGRLRSHLDGSTPTVVYVTGLPGVGKSELVARVVADFAGVYQRCPPLPDAAQRASLAERLGRVAHDSNPTAVSPPADASWATLFDYAVDCAARADRPFVVVLDDAHRLVEARARITRPMDDALARATDASVRLHVVMVGRAGGLPSLDDGARAANASLALGPLPFRSAAAHLPGTRPDERLRAYGVFGGIPRVLSALDRSVTVGTNVRRLMLGDGGALADAPISWLEREVQTPSRYVSILGTLAKGDADWATVHAGVSDLTRSGQVAPYLNRLISMGMIEALRPLDAGPRTRTTRYSIVDPFLAFWYRFVFPWWLSDRVDPVGPHYATAIRPRVHDHMEGIMPRVCRQHMSLDAIETLGSVARESGSLWGSGLEIPVAGTLTSGSAYYGVTRWQEPDQGMSPLTVLDAMVRETRYGFGREHRLRLMFMGQTTPAWLRREAARRHDAVLIDAEALLGGP